MSPSLFETVLAHAKDATARAIVRDRILSAEPVTLDDIAAASGVSKQAISQREQRILGKLDGDARGLVRFRVGARRWFARGAIREAERADLRRKLAACGWSVAVVAEMGLVSESVVIGRIDALGMRSEVSEGIRAHKAARDAEEMRVLKEGLAAHGYSVWAMCNGDRARVGRVYALLHQLGMVEWLVAARDRTRTQPVNGTPLVRSEPKPHQKHRTLYGRRRGP